MNVTSFSLRKLSLVTLALLISSQCLTFTVYQAGLREHQEQKLQQQQAEDESSSSSSSVFHFITHWKVRDADANNLGHPQTKKAKVRPSATESSTKAAGYLPPGTIVQVVPYPRNPKYLFVIHPIRGFALRTMFQPLPELDDDASTQDEETSPYLFTGYRIETGRHRNVTARYLYAPWRLVVAQQLWNALQVCQVVLTVTIWYVLVVMVRTTHRCPVESHNSFNHDKNNNNSYYYSVNTVTTTEPRRLSWRRRILVGCGWMLLLAVMLLLPFSIYVTSPGAIVLTVLSLMTCFLGLLWNDQDDTHGRLVVWTVGIKDNEQQQQQQMQQQMQHCPLDKNINDDDDDDDSVDDNAELFQLGSSNHQNRDISSSSSNNNNKATSKDEDIEEAIMIVSEQENLMGDPTDQAMATATALPLSKTTTAAAATTSTTATTRTYGLVREEMLGFLCNLASSLYNYHASNATWPHWHQLFRRIDRYFGWPDGNSSVDVFDAKIYTLGLTEDINVPLYVPGQNGSTFGVHLFWILWSIIPVLYIAYYFCMFQLAPRSPGVKLQRALLLFAMFHFLFMTDVVSYRYGRGYLSPHAELFHWFERWSWRVAVLMPIYQNCTSGHWKHHGHERFPWLGQLLHYTAALWGLGFFVWQVVCRDCVRFLFFLTGTESTTALPELLGITSSSELEDDEQQGSSFHPFSYHGGLVLMWSMYLFLLVGGFQHIYLSIGIGKAHTNIDPVRGNRCVV